MEKHESAQNEIELIEILMILWKRKILIAIGTVVCILFACLLILILPQIYEVSAILEPGYDLRTQNPDAPDAKTRIVDPEEIRQRILGGAYNNKISKKLNIAEKDFPKIKAVVPKNTSLVQISIESSEPNRALDILNELVDQITLTLEERIELSNGELENQIKLTEIENRVLVDRIDLIKNQIAEIKGKVKDLYQERQKAMSASPSNAMSVLLYSNEIQTQQIYLNNLEEKNKDLQERVMGGNIKVGNLKLKLNNSVAVYIDKAPIISDSPIKPKKFLIVVLAAILGMFGSLFLAFCLEYFSRVRQLEKI